jgi:uncharacterized protein (TIGR01777 family)
MRIVIAGGTGFIGKHLTEMLLEEGHQVIILTRAEKRSKQNIKYIQWMTMDAHPEKEMGDVDAFINLAGVSINEGRWTASHKKSIYESRMMATDELIRILSKLPKKPKVFINASAIGIYPSSLQKIYTENSTEIADDFLGKTVRDWEKKAQLVKKEGIRTAYLRFGVVLGKHEGALPLMVFPYRLFVGGTIGSGQQWVSWIHVKDAVRAILFTMNNEKINGAVNVTAPCPTQMNNFGKAIGDTLHRPHWFPLPGFLIKAAMGEKSSLVLQGQHVLPEVLEKAGFPFLFPSLEAALKDLL